MYPAYNTVREAKIPCLPNGIQISEVDARVSVQDALTHTVKRLVLLQKDVLLNCPEVRNLTLLCKYGLDGSTCHSDWKIAPHPRARRPVVPVEEEDEVEFFEEFNVEQEQEQERPYAFDQILMVCFVPLILHDERKRVIWRNPRPGSSIFCRPLSIEFLRETRETIKAAADRTKRQIDRLGNIITDVTPERAVNVQSKFLLTMIDGKTFSTLNDIPSHQVNTHQVNFLLINFALHLFCKNLILSFLILSNPI